MEIIESDKYRDIGKGTELVLSKSCDAMGEERRRDLLIQKKRCDAHEKIERATGIKFAVAKKVDKGVGGFVQVDSIKAHITESMLDDPELAEKVAHHENGHVKHLNQGVTDIDLEDYVVWGELTVLNGYMKERGVDLENTDLLEGFNEFGTAKEHGVNEKCGYNKKEVPAAEILEKLCMENTGRSLLEAFKAGNMELFYELVKSICAIIKLKNEFKMAA